MKLIYLIICNILLFVVINNAEERFPSPEFETEYKIPDIDHNSIYSDLKVNLDIIVLIITLFIASYLIIKIRKRSYIYLLTFFSLIYFGFFRGGCICSIGSIQNVVLSLIDKNYVIPVSITSIFILPVVFALFFGRVFCSSVCPLGAFQELILFKHVRLQPVLKNILSIFPFIYLAITLLFLVEKGDFIICQFDPFIDIFRMAFNKTNFYYTVPIVLISVFVARPYCRFICPYSPILATASYFSKKHIEITNEDCIKCRLCEQSCPVEAIDIPEKENKKNIKIKKIAVYLLLAPIIIFITVNIINSLYTIIINPEKNSSHLHTSAIIAGIFIGFIIISKLISLNLKKDEERYKVNRFNCISCGRCIEYCPKNEG